MSQVIRLHDYIQDNEPMPRTLIRAARKDELFTQLLNAADRFVSATRRERTAAERELLQVVDRVKRRLGESSVEFDSFRRRNIERVILPEEGED